MVPAALYMTHGHTSLLSRRYKVAPKGPCNVISTPANVIPRRLDSVLNNDLLLRGCSLMCVQRTSKQSEYGVSFACLCI